MKTRGKHQTAVALTLAIAATVLVAAPPAPLPHHPGNIFLEGEEVVIPLPDEFAPAVRWTARGLEGQRVGQGECAAPRRLAVLGRAPVGWYRVDGLDAQGQPVAWTTAAVLKPLAVAPSADTPVRVDTANAWFTRTGAPEGDQRKMAAFASLAALAGAGGARDRLTWGELESAPGLYAPQTRYDDSARILRGAGLEVLQVFHSTPLWARTPRLEENSPHRRFPRDLRDIYRFSRAMAQRYQGLIQAWEPWNEANIPGFGGHLIDEMCALQKAAYLGFKAGDPDLTVCWNVYAGSGTSLHALGVEKSHCHPYFDTYNNHTYSPVENYREEFATARAGAGGKPLWLSECGIHVRWNAPQGELPEDEESRQARFIAKSYASSLFAGVDKHYFFILGNYCESQVQFGLLRHDLTPRRGYLALAAVGRLLAEARALGRLTNGAARVYAFAARPDGQPRDVLIAWDEEARARTTLLPADKIETLYDCYGRRLHSGLPETLSPAPLIAILPQGAAATLLPLEPPPGAAAPPPPAAASQIVMQMLLPESLARLDTQAYEINPGSVATLPLALYNFGQTSARGSLRAIELPRDWHLQLPQEPLELRPMERLTLGARLLIKEPAGRRELMGDWIVLQGDFGAAGAPRLACRMACPSAAITPARSTSIRSAQASAAWRDNIVSGARMTHAGWEGRTLFEMQFPAGCDPWGYPRLVLKDDERPPAGTEGLLVELHVVEGSGTLRVQFVEHGGSSFLTELPYDFAKGGVQKVLALFANTQWGAHSPANSAGRLTPENISSLLIGINAKPDSRVRLAIGGLAWVAY